jgi:hypothetical protein
MSIQTLHWKDHFKNDRRSDQDHRLKLDRRSDQDHPFKKIYIRSRSNHISFFAPKVAFLGSFFEFSYKTFFGKLIIFSVFLMVTFCLF